MHIQYNFEWDPDKAKLNKEKHKGNFENATTVFKDSKAITIFDEENSEKENRWVTMGIPVSGPLLVVHHTFKQIDNNTVNIRIFSSRKAARIEKKQYVEI